MRRRGDEIEVRLGRMDDPAQFVWRQQLWRVLAIESRWIESGEWWTSSQVRQARGEEWVSSGSSSERLVGSTDAEAGESGDLLRESEVWRVEAANGMAGSRGVYELAHCVHDGAWRLRAVID